MEQIAKLGPFAALSKLWNDLSPAQRALAAAFVALSVAVASFAAVIVAKPRMSVLFSGLEAEDAGAIAQKLDEAKVPYTTSADSSTIQVPSNQVDRMRLGMATQGLPQGGSVGFELFDKSSFGMTEFAERVSYQRAVQGELKRTICSLAPVMAARVHLAIPENRVYAGEQDPTTASVVLKLRRGMPLTDEQVGGVVHLVSSAVEGLKPANVTVIDSEGNVLSEALSGGGGGLGRMTSNQSKLKRQYESTLAANLQGMLGRVVGPNKAVVRVSAEMNFDQKHATSETYEPAAVAPAGGPAETPSEQGTEHGVLRSEESTSETYTGNVRPPGSVPVSTPGGGASAEGDKYSLAKSSRQYNISKRIEETVTAPGKVERLSVAVLVDESVKAAKVPTIRQVVSAAAGLDEDGGDEITVQRIAFDTSSEKAAAAEMASASKTDLIMTLAKNAGAAVLLIAFLILLRSIVRQIKVQTPTARAAGPVAEAGGGMQMQRAENVMQEVPTPSGVQGPAPPKPPPAQTADLPPEVAQSNPEDLAKLVRSWMSEQ